jgi:rhamnosyltransferase
VTPLLVAGDTFPAPGSPSVSVVIRNRNEAASLELVLRALALQALRPREIVVVDNESSDGSAELARGRGATVVPLAAGAFSYGRALNLGLAATTADVCVILSAHALPLGREFLTECVRPFSDDRVAAVRCTYVGKAADEVRWLSPELLDQTADIATVVSKGPLASGCAIRRRVWECVRFDEEVIAAEEKLWAARVLKAGFTIVSPCPAFYCYMKRLSVQARIKKNHRELLQIYRSTGMRLGFVGATSAFTLLDFLRGVLVRAPRDGLARVSEESLRLVLRWRFGRDARRLGPPA